MELISQNLKIYSVMRVYMTWEEQPWEWNLYNCFHTFKKTTSKIYQYKINNNIKLSN